MRDPNLVARQKSNGRADTVDRRPARGPAFQAKAQLFLHAPAHADNDMTGPATVHDFNQFIILDRTFGVFGGDITVGNAEWISFSL